MAADNILNVYQHYCDAIFGVHCRVRLSDWGSSRNAAPNVSLTTQTSKPSAPDDLIRLCLERRRLPFDPEHEPRRVAIVCIWSSRPYQRPIICSLPSALLLSVTERLRARIAGWRGPTASSGCFYRELPAAGCAVYPLDDLAKEAGRRHPALRHLLFTVISAAFGTYLLSSVVWHLSAELLDPARWTGRDGRASCGWVVVPVAPTLGACSCFFFIWTCTEFLLCRWVLPGLEQNQCVFRHPPRLGTLQVPAHHEPADPSARRCSALLPTVICCLSSSGL